MARWIELDIIDPHQSQWIIPESYIKFDHRDAPWPNQLWPWAAVIETKPPRFDQEFMIRLRRWVDRTLSGDVVIRYLSTSHYNDHVAFYFDNGEDYEKFWDTYMIYIVKVEEPLADLSISI
jgi:hypothetical protein